MSWWKRILGGGKGESETPKHRRVFCRAHRTTRPSLGFARSCPILRCLRISRAAIPGSFGRSWGAFSKPHAVFAASLGPE